jgi:hypothetical protein
MIELGKGGRRAFVGASTQRAQGRPLGARTFVSVVADGLG